MVSKLFDLVYLGDQINRGGCGRWCVRVSARVSEGDQLYFLEELSYHLHLLVKQD